MLGEVLNTDAFEDAGDGVIHARQRFLDGATGRQIAGFCALGARSDEKRAINGKDDFIGRNRACRPR
jgi:hypothetical protein